MDCCCNCLAQYFFQFALPLTTNIKVDNQLRILCNSTYILFLETSLIWKCCVLRWLRLPFASIAVLRWTEWASLVVLAVAKTCFTCAVHDWHIWSWGFKNSIPFVVNRWVQELACPHFGRFKLNVSWSHLNLIIYKLTKFNQFKFQKLKSKHEIKINLF